MGGSLTMTKCTSIGEYIHVEAGASLVMEDSRVFGSSDYGVICHSDMKLTRGTIEGHGAVGVLMMGEHASGELSDCVVHKNGSNGVQVQTGKVMLRGGTITENKEHGVVAYSGAKITVAKAEEGKLQTVSNSNNTHYWHTHDSSWQITGIPQEKINPESVSKNISSR